MNMQLQCLIFNDGMALFLQDELLNSKEDRRHRYGHEIDFPDYKPPFQKNMIHRAEATERELKK